jgi:hypothetical protein
LGEIAWQKGVEQENIYQITSTFSYATEARQFRNMTSVGTFLSRADERSWLVRLAAESHRQLVSDPLFNKEEANARRERSLN